MTGENRRQNIAAELRRGEEALKSAEILAAAGQNAESEAVRVLRAEGFVE